VKTEYYIQNNGVSTTRKHDARLQEAGAPLDEAIPGLPFGGKRAVEVLKDEMSEKSN